jgi:hypothetical protein
MEPLLIRVICGVLAVVLLGVIVLRRRNKEQREHEN